MNRIIISIGIALFLTTAVYAARPGSLRLIEEAYEVTDLQLTWRSSATGVIRLQPCDEGCAMIQLNFGADTLAIDEDGTEVPLETIRSWRGNEATITVDIDNPTEVLRILNQGPGRPGGDV
jgi:hypothetical protein